MVNGIEHTAIVSPDPARLAQWYVKHLGFRVNFQAPNSPNCFIKAADGTMIEIIVAGRSLAGAPKLDDPGIRHLALAVDDFDSEYRRLKAEGVPFLSEASINGGVSVAFFTDPEGNILHLLHRETPLP